MIKIEGNNVSVLIGANDINMGVYSFPNQDKIEALVFQELIDAENNKQVAVIFNSPQFIDLIIEKLSIIKTNLLAPKIEIQPEVVEPKPKKRPRTKRK